MPQRILDLVPSGQFLLGYAELDQRVVYLGTSRQHSIGGAGYRCSAELTRIDTVTKRRERVGFGGKPTLSPDRSKLAYAAVRSDSTSMECGLDTIRIIDVQTGAESTTAGPEPIATDRYAAFWLRWSPDSTHLHYIVGIEHSDALSPPLIVDTRSLHVVVASVDTDLDRALTARFAPDVAQGQWTLGGGLWLPDGSLAVRLRCGACQRSDPPSPGWFRLPPDGVLRTLEQTVSLDELRSLPEGCNKFYLC